MFPVFLALVPLFFLVKDLNMTATYQGLILVYIAYSLPFTIFFLTGFFRTLPSEVGEAALVDGASHYRIFFNIMLPMAAPGLIAMGIFNFLGQWNQFLLPLVLMPDENKYVLSQGLAFLAIQQGYAQRLQRPLCRDDDHDGPDPGRLRPLPAPPRIRTNRRRPQGLILTLKAIGYVRYNLRARR